MTKKKITLAFSPCPNDTFIFDALIHNRIDTEGLEFDFFIKDVEELNKMAMKEAYDISKLSYYCFGVIAKNYLLLDSGSALGNKCGPLLIAKNSYKPEEVNNLKIAIPGKYTTANFLLSLAFPHITHKKEMLFSLIENAVLTGRVDAGLIIHETRFTYMEKSLFKIIDLGDYWEHQTGLPIPLGGIAIRRSFTVEMQKKINRLLRNSIEYALTHRNISLNFIKQHAREMNDKVIEEHINLYVNKYTISLGQKGKKAVNVLFNMAKEKGIVSYIEEKLFVTP